MEDESFSELKERFDRLFSEHERLKKRQRQEIENASETLRRQFRDVQKQCGELEEALAKARNGEQIKQAEENARTIQLEALRKEQDLQEQVVSLTLHIDHLMDKINAYEGRSLDPAVAAEIAIDLIRSMLDR